MERVSTYNEYLMTELSLTLEEMNNLHIQMRMEIGTDEIALELWK